MITEEDAIEQMRHFSKCGECIHYARERAEECIFWAPLHPLLLNFINYSDQTGFQQWICEELQNSHNKTIWRREEEEIFRDAIRLVGRRLLEEFMRFIEESPSEIVQDYEIEKRQSRHGMAIRARGNIPHEEDTIPITQMEDIEKAAIRLTFSVENLLQGKRYGKEVQERCLAYLSPFSENISQSLEFLDWLSTKYPKLNIVGDIPSEKIDSMVQLFCEEKKFSNVASFNKSVKRWMKGEAPENVLNKIFSFLLAKKSDGSRSNGSPFNRYQSVRMHGMFLFLSTGDFPAFIDMHWRDLNALTGDSLDIYFSKDDLKKRVSGYETLAEFKSLSIPVVQLPGLILWEDSLKNARAVPLGRLEHEEIMEVMKHVVYRINEWDSVEKVVLSATRFVSSLLNDRKSDSTGLVETQIIINGGENIMNNNTSFKVIKSQVGAMGPNANASDMVFSQIWDAHSKELDLPALAIELSRLREALRKEPQTDENDIAIGAIAKAEGSAKEGSGPKTLGDLKSAGKVALSCAEKIGMDVAAAAIKAALGL